MIIAYLDATRTQEEVAKEYGYSNKSTVSRLIDGVSCIIADAAKKQPENIDEYPAKRTERKSRSNWVTNFSKDEIFCNPPESRQHFERHKFDFCKGCKNRIPFEIKTYRRRKGN